MQHLSICLACLFFFFLCRRFSAADILCWPSFRMFSCSAAESISKLSVVCSVPFATGSTSCTLSAAIISYAEPSTGTTWFVANHYHSLNCAAPPNALLCFVARASPTALLAIADRSCSRGTACARDAAMPSALCQTPFCQAPLPMPDAILYSDTLTY